MENTESLRIAAQLRNAFTGDAWHGDCLQVLLSPVTPEQANTRPADGAHSIGELVWHIDIYVRTAFEAIQGVPMPRLYVTGEDWPGPIDPSPAGWTAAIDTLFRNAEKLAGAISGFPDDRLQEAVPGREYDFYYLFHGIVQHSLYHAGQIALLKRLTPAP